MKKVLDTFAEGQVIQYGWAREDEPTSKGLGLVVVGAFLGVIVAKFFGM